MNKLVDSAAFKRYDHQAETDIDVYEKIQDEIRSAMSEGRQAGMKLFLRWLDGKTFIRTPDGSKIDLTDTFSLKEFKQLDRLFREDHPPQVEAYQRRRKGVLPTF